MLKAIFLFGWLNRLILKAKWRSLWRHIWRHHILTNLNNAKIMFQIPSCSNLLLKNRVFKLRGSQMFVYKSKMSTKVSVQVANLKFDLQSESYRSILVIMHFSDDFYSKIPRQSPTKFTSSRILRLSYSLISLNGSLAARFFTRNSAVSQVLRRVDISSKILPLSFFEFVWLTDEYFTAEKDIALFLPFHDR